MPLVGGITIMLWITFAPDYDFFPTLLNSAFEAEFDSHSIEFLLVFHVPI